MADLQELIVLWRLSRVTRLTETGIARLWKADSPDHGTCVVKHYKRGSFGNEISGLAYQTALGPDHAAAVLDQTDDAALMPFLKGPLLGDMSRAGRDADATHVLADVARGVLAAKMSFKPALVSLQDNCSALAALQIAADCPSPLAQDIARAKEWMAHLLATQPTPRPLHGDLHHDNVIVTDVGPKVIDAKGLWGDPGYELANAMRNPKGAESLLETPDALMRRAQIWAQATACPLDRFLQWTAAKCGLSIAWRAKGVLRNDDEAPLLRRFIQLADQ